MRRITMQRSLMFYGARMTLTRSIVGWVSPIFRIAFRRKGSLWGVFAVPSYGNGPLATGKTMQAAAEAWYDAGMPGQEAS